MRGLIGSLALIGGVAGLGLWATNNHAVRIEARVSAAALDAVRSGGLATGDPLDIRVSGRDVAVSGLVEDPDAVARLLTAVNGVRVLDVSGVQTLPKADPFEVAITALDGGQIVLDGVVPSQATIQSLRTLGAETGRLMRAAGVPDDAWGVVVGRAVQVAGAIQSPEITVSDRAVTVKGVVDTPRDRDAALALLAPLPDSYGLDNQITTLDDGTPLRLNLILRDGVVTGSGKVPSDMVVDAIGARFVQSTGLTVTQSSLPATDPTWPSVARAGLVGLAGLIDGRLAITGTDVFLSGAGTPDAIARAEVSVRDLPQTYTVTTDLAIWDDGAPLEMTMEWDGNTASADGKLPAGFTLRGPAGVAVTSTADRSFLPDDGGTFTVNSRAGAAALGLLEAGRVVVTADRIDLSGTAAFPQIDLTLNSVFAQVGAQTIVRRDITYLDDGSPASWVLSYDVSSGARVDGRLPNGVGPRDVADAIGIVTIDGTAVTALADTDAGNSLIALGIIGDYLREVDALTFNVGPDGQSVDVTASPGVDLAQIASDLADRLPVDVAFSLSPADPAPAEGATRRNVLTGLDEAFRNGFWVPVLTFTADLAGCRAQADAVLAASDITFLSSSDVLGATSIRAINALAAVAGPCLDAGLTLEIGGHTDATGSAVANETLSFDRANAVRAALAVRGIPTDAMTVRGYGQAQPIADNSTAEGRAANRRTSLTWANPEP